MFGKPKKQFDAFDAIIERAKNSNIKIVLPEGKDPRIQKAAEWAALNNLCKIVLLGDKITLASRFSPKALKNITIIDPISSTKTRELYARKLYELRKDKGLTEVRASEELKDNIIYAMMMLKCDDADGVVAGAVLESADVLRHAFRIIKTHKDYSKVSSVMILQTPEGSNIGENGFLVLADCAVIENPTAEELAEIAILSSKTAAEICSIKPNVALLSYSTKASDDYDSEEVQKVKQAYRIVRRKNSSLRIDGDLQVDAALDAEVCKFKAGNSVVEGKANVLIFPDLMAGNIAYKLAQRVAGVKAVGPILQGLAKPVNDLSRGATVDEIILNIAITVLQSKGYTKIY